MVLPSAILNTAQSQPMLVELKNGETYNGHLVDCDSFMNLTLRGVIYTSAGGDTFWKLAEVYIRGSSVKYLRLPEQVIDMVKEDVARARAQSTRGRGGARGGGPGAGGRGGTPRGGYRGGTKGGHASATRGRR